MSVSIEPHNHRYSTSWIAFSEMLSELRRRKKRHAAILPLHQLQHTTLTDQAMSPLVRLSLQSYPDSLQQPSQFLQPGLGVCLVNTELRRVEASLADLEELASVVDADEGGRSLSKKELGVCRRPIIRADALVRASLELDQVRLRHLFPCANDVEIGGRRSGVPREAQGR